MTEPYHCILPTRPGTRQVAGSAGGALIVGTTPDEEKDIIATMKDSFSGDAAC